MERAAAPHVPAANNFRDGFGERRRVAHANGDAIELLCLRRELTAVPSFEFALRERASRLATFRHDAFARVRNIDRLSEPSAALAVVSDFTRGVRLSQLLTPNDRRSVTVDINAAQRLIRQILAAVAALHESARDLAHGAIALDRLIVTANARVMIGEYVLGAALEQLRYSPERYWEELRVALPPSAAAVKFDRRVDVVQIGVVALSLVLGRPLRDEEGPKNLGDVLAAATGIAPRGGPEPLSNGLREWLARALQLDSGQSFASAPEARAAFEKLLLSASIDTRQNKAGRRPAGEDGGSSQSEHRPSPNIERSRTADSEVGKADAKPSSEAVEIAPSTRPHPLQRVSEPPVAAPSGESRAITTAVPRTEQESTGSGPAAATPSAESANRAFVAAQTFVPETSRDSTAVDVSSDGPAGTADESFGDATQGSRSGTRWFRTAIAATLVAAVVAGGVYAARWFFAAPAPPATTGTLKVASTPAGAQVFVDRQGRGMTPLTLTLRPGPHSIELRGVGEPRTVDVTIVAGTESSQMIELMPKSAAPAPGQLQVKTEPAGAQITVDGVVRGKAPLVVDGLTPGEHTVVLEGELGIVTQTVAVESSATASIVVPMAAAPSAPVSGWITVRAPVDVDIRENGKVLGTSHSERIMVSAGRHQLEIVSDTLGYSTTSIVQVTPGKVVPVKLEWPKGVISLNAEPWAEVSIDGEKVGDTPIGNLSLPIGPHEIVFRHPDLGERRYAVSVSLKAPARVSVEMSKQ